MSHTYRFFADRLSPGLWQLEDEEAQHALKVLRLENEAVIEVMDGRGLVGVGKLSIETKTKVFAVDVVESDTPKDQVCRTIILGALKPGDIDDMIAPLVELGPKNAACSVFRKSVCSNKAVTQVGAGS